MSDESPSRSPEPEELLRMAITYFLEDVHTCLPGRIEEYDPATQKASVKPLIKRRTVADGDQEILEELPIIPDVPVAFPRTRSFFLTFPLQVGDLVMLHFSERSLDNWLSGTGDDTDPDEFRMHDLSDAIAVPGFYPFSQAVKDIDSDRMALGADNGGMQIHIAPGKIEVTEAGEAGKHVAIVETLETLWGSLKTYLDTHIHTDPVSGVTTPPTTPSPSWDTAVNSSKVGIPDG